ncbi:PH domain-containing protein [Patescibacteria group bacterium]|nr:PH domain-containing protein [Patescibacteria group bacterium]MBU1029447.1 PH domain-containing protein [Patescibacteria group bacterium]MBU1916237.1 PH domain-containing protein [Patescibacteria group bacterium]
MHIDELIHKKSGEQVVFFLRRHIIVFIGGMLLIIFMMFIPFGAYWLINANWPQLLNDTLIGPIMKLVASAYYFWVWLFLFSNFIDYYLDAWIVTNDRILNVEQSGLFNRTVSELDLINIQDVTSEVHGVLPFLFGYGDVFVQTAAEKSRFVFEQVPQPEEIRKRLLMLVEEEQKNLRSVNRRAEE